MPLLRLDKMLSGLGMLSRSETRAYVRAGRITVDGRCAASADQKLDPEASAVAVDGVPVHYSAHCCYMLNKPAGVLSATEDARERTVLDLLDAQLRRRGLFPVGRLDKDTEGLLLLTDDGDLAHRISAPKSGVVKTYFARVDAEPEPGAEVRFAQGLVLPDGTQCRPARLERLGACEVRVQVSEGKFHQVKRMLAAVGSGVTYLKRTAIGGLPLDANLPLGRYKLLDDEEIGLIFETFGDVL